MEDETADRKSAAPIFGLPRSNDKYNNYVGKYAIFLKGGSYIRAGRVKENDEEELILNPFVGYSSIDEKTKIIEKDFILKKWDFGEMYETSEEELNAYCRSQNKFSKEQEKLNKKNIPKQEKR